MTKGQALIKFMTEKLEIPEMVVADILDNDNGDLFMHLKDDEPSYASDEDGCMSDIKIYCQSVDYITLDFDCQHQDCRTCPRRMFWHEEFIQEVDNV